MTALLVVLGAAVGAPTRYLLDRFVQARHDSVFPWGTFVVNVSGSLALGVLAGGTAYGSVAIWAGTLAGTGFCGALTTYSTFSYETLRLLELDAWRAALLNVLGSLTTGVLAATAGWAFAAAIWS